MTSEGAFKGEIPQDMQDAPTAQQNAFNEFEARIADLEARLANNDLSEESKIRGLLISEIKQRILIRRVAVTIAIAVILFMAYFLAHAVHKYFWLKMLLIPQSIIVAMLIAPIISITTLSVLLIIGAFRRFNDDDMPKVNVASLAAELARKSM